MLDDDDGGVWLLLDDEWLLEDDESPLELDEDGILLELELSDEELDDMIMTSLITCLN